MAVFRLAASFAALLIALVTLSPNTGADSSGTLTLSGRVPAHYSVRLIPGLESLDANGYELARLIEFRNGEGFFSITVSSANSGRQKNLNAAADYELLFDSRPLDVRRGPASVNIDARSEHIVKIKINPSSSITQSDTLTFSVAAM